jgi:hypothetical protein
MEVSISRRTSSRRRYDRGPRRPQKVIFGDNWHLTTDGRRFLINTIEDSNVQAIRVVLNWQAGLKK